MKMVGCIKLGSAATYCMNCDKSGDPGTCLNLRLMEKRRALIRRPDGEITIF